MTLEREVLERKVREFGELVESLAAFAASDGEQHPSFRSRQTKDLKKQIKARFREALGVEP